MVDELQRLHFEYMLGRRRSVRPVEMASAPRPAAGQAATKSAASPAYDDTHSSVAHDMEGELALPIPAARCPFSPPSHESDFPFLSQPTWPSSSSYCRIRSKWHDPTLSLLAQGAPRERAASVAG